VKTKLVSINGAIHPFFSYPGKKTEDGTFDYHFYRIYLGIFVKSCQQVIDAVKEFMANL
jgi:hypothetical protein